MRKFIIGTILLFLFSIYSSLAQETAKLNIGLGMGIDYGGFGTRLTYLPVKQTGLFASVGYNLNSVGYNFGAQFRFPSEKRISCHLTGMYGYNTVLIVESTTISKTTYFGPSIGAGMELKFKKETKQFLSFEVLLPFRPQAYQNAVDDLRLIGFEVKDQAPLLFSIGYHFSLNN